MQKANKSGGTEWIIERYHAPSSVEAPVKGFSFTTATSLRIEEKETKLF